MKLSIIKQFRLEEALEVSGMKYSPKSEPSLNSDVVPKYDRSPQGYL